MVTYTIYDCLEKLTVILFPESQIILLVKKKKNTWVMKSISKSE